MCIRDRLELLLDDAHVRAALASSRERCEGMLRSVPDGPKGDWARRTHIFQQIVDL